MDSNEEIKQEVRKHYAEIAAKPNGSGCCGGGACGMPEAGSFSEDYTRLAGHVSEADLGLGCGLPTDLAGIKSGDVVVDLGSGAGNDVFVARAMVGNGGRVIGIDMTEVMIAKANVNNRKLGYRNVDFRLGEIEAIPVDSATVDVVISNCVLNLVPDKAAAYREIHRIIKPGGHFSISDIVLEGEFPAVLRKVAELYVGCIAGADDKDHYLETIRKSGFQDVGIVKEKEVFLPPSLIEGKLPTGSESRARGFSIKSITVTGTRPSVEIDG
jgi:arsenite methyltransferase